VFGFSESLAPVRQIIYNDWLETRIYALITGEEDEKKIHVHLPNGNVLPLSQNFRSLFDPESSPL
jgi:hypothetical protein